jgi:hypothetical protein
MANVQMNRFLQETSDLTPVMADVELVRRVVVKGTVRDKETGKPVPGCMRYAPLKGNKPLQKLAGLDIHANCDIRP